MLIFQSVVVIAIGLIMHVSVVSRARCSYVGIRGGYRGRASTGGRGNIWLNWTGFCGRLWNVDATVNKYQLNYVNNAM